MWARGRIGVQAKYMHKYTRAAGETANGAPLLFTGAGHFLYRSKRSGAWCFTFAKEDIEKSLGEPNLDKQATALYLYTFSDWDCSKYML